MFRLAQADKNAPPVYELRQSSSSHGPVQGDHRQTTESGPLQAKNLRKPQRVPGCAERVEQPPQAFWGCWPAQMTASVKLQANFPHVPQAAPGDPVRVLQPPQALLLDSHPVAGLPLQLANPALHLMTQAPKTQATEARFGNGNDGQRLPQRPQLLISVRGLLSHPVAGLPLQLANPALQALGAQAPATQATAAAFGNDVQSLPQAPQLKGFVERGSQIPAQEDWP